MLQKSTFLSLSAVFVTVGAVAGIPSFARAEPPACYSDAPRVLPAPMEYGRAYRTADATIPYLERPTRVSYRRAYSEPVVDTTRVVTTAPAVEYEEPVVYTRTYYQPTTEVYTYATPYYGSYGYVGASYYRPSYRYGHHDGSYGYRQGHHSYYRPRHYTRHRSHRSYGHRSHGYRSYGHRSSGHRSYGHRSYRGGSSHHRSHGSRWGFSLGHSRGSHGRSSGGFSFHYGH